MPPSPDPAAAAGVAPVVTADALRTLLTGEGSGRVVLLEVRREPGPADARRTGVPGALLVGLTADLVGTPGEGTGSLPLPGRAQVQDRVERWGVDPDSVVVVYTRDQPALAARAWWTLRWAGVPGVRYLDGGLDAWVAAGGALGEHGEPPGSGTLRVSPGSLPVLDDDGAAALARSGLLLDARESHAYAGGVTGGHVPGARHLPSAANLDGLGRLRDAGALRTAYDAVGLTEGVEVGAYCGGGTSATLDVLALATLGVTAALYPGSWSAWSSDPSRPVAAGDRPG
ncbi:MULTISPECIES: sulfurtransferase [unclassified Nocardioides]|uniref:sulfurtransferase n=1 Tax=unclassified Nocardioides TaxID=2615069 RepID=UPI003015230A